MLPKTSIIWNNNPDNEECYFCGKEFLTIKGRCLVLENSFEYVCHECGDKNYPEMMSLLDKMAFPD